VPGRSTAFVSIGYIKRCRWHRFVVFLLLQPACTNDPNPRWSAREPTLDLALHSVLETQMKSDGSAKVLISTRVKDELREFVVIAAYLFVCFTALAYLKASILRAHGTIEFAPFGFAAIKALVCAKFVSVGHVLHIGERYKSLPLVWPTLYKSVTFLALLLALMPLRRSSWVSFTAEPSLIL
jgi:hypothetical protein